MKKLIVIFMILLSSCGLFQSIESRNEYLRSQFPNCTIDYLDDVDLVYILTDTVQCKTYTIIMSPYYKNKIDEVNHGLKLKTE